MTRPVRSPWWQQSWLLGALIAVGLVLVVLDIWAQAWLGLAGTVLALIAFVGLWDLSRRQRRERTTQHPPGP